MLFSTLPTPRFQPKTVRKLEKEKRKASKKARDQSRKWFYVCIYKVFFLIFLFVFHLFLLNIFIINLNTGYMLYGLGVWGRCPQQGQLVAVLGVWRRSPQQLVAELGVADGWAGGLGAKNPEKWGFFNNNCSNLNHSPFIKRKLSHLSWN